MMGDFFKFLVLTVLYFVKNGDAHGRMLEPPNRSSLWRLNEYDNLEPPVPINYDDDQFYCGSLGNMIQNGGKCGPCGDPYEQKRPRENENSGKFGEGLIVRSYQIGQTIDIAVELTTNHWGYFTWSICNLDSVPNPSGPEPENCFDEYPLKLGDGSGSEFNLTQNSPGFYNTTVKLPQGLKCDHCVLRWNYRAGNNWEFCDETNETGSTNCGYQETFRGCSDISIGSNLATTKRPFATSPIWDVQIVGHQNEHKATIPPMRPPKSLLAFL